MNLKNALQTVALLLLCVSFAGCSENKDAASHHSSPPEETPKAKISTEVSPEEAASIAALEKKLQDRYQSTEREKLTTWKDLDKMLRSYARSTYSPKLPITPVKETFLVNPGARCGEALYERLPYREGASFMRKFVTKQSSGGEYLLQNLAASDSNFPVFIKAKIDVAGTTVPMVVVLNALNRQATPIVLDFIQAGLVKKTSNKEDQSFNPNNAFYDEGPKCSWCLELSGESPEPDCSCTVLAKCKKSCGGSGECTPCPVACKPHVGEDGNLPLLFSPTKVPFEPYRGGGFTDPLPPNFNTFSLPRL